jgi:hypothetical protein
MFFSLGFELGLMRVGQLPYLNNVYDIQIQIHEHEGKFRIIGVLIWPNRFTRLSYFLVVQSRLAIKSIASMKGLRFIYRRTKTLRLATTTLSAGSKQTSRGVLDGIITSTSLILKFTGFLLSIRLSLFSSSLVFAFI